MESVEVGGKNSTGKNSPDAIEKSRSNSDSVADTSSNGFTNNFASISTIQNIYDGKEIERDKSNLTRTNSFKSRISKTAYLQLHRQSSSTGVSTVDRLKGRYEDISKTTDNSTANTVVRSKIITFVSPEENLKTIDTKLQAKTNPNNLHRQEASQSNNERSPHITEPQPQTPEELLSKTKSNIEQLQKTLSTKLSTDTIAQLRNKYSPASFGYPKSILKTSIPKKVQFSEQISKIPIPTPRISIKSKDECDHTDNLEIKEVKGVIVKEISTTHTIPAQEPESNFKPPVHTKDENFNVIDTEAVIAKQLPSILNPSATFENARYKNNSVDLEEVRGIEIEVEYENITFAEPEDKHFIVRRSSSDDSIEKLESSLSEFIMEKKTKEKKRSNSFRKILTGGFFGRDKKKPSDNQQKKDQVVFSDNAQNESQVFERSSSHRHTVDNSCSRQQVQKNAFEPKKSPGPLYYYSPSTKFQRTNEGDSYTEMNNSAPFVSNRPPKYSPEHYLPMDNSHATTQPDTSLNYNGVNKYFDTSSSSSNTIDYDSRNSTYQNALIAQAEMRQIREAENSNKNKPVRNRNDFTESRTDSPENRSVSPELFRDSPVDSDTSKYVQLVKPKALIPINSERPLPNPYHNKYEKIKNTENYQNLELSQTLNRNLNLDNSKPYPQKSNLYNRSDRTINDSQVIVEDIYGTVFDSISPQKVGKVTPDGQRVHGVSPEQRSSLSPKSLEASKLKLPPNREKVDLQPRIRSPIPQTKVSTDKIIATELLRNKRSPTRTSPVTRDGGGRYSSPTRTSPIVRGGSGRYNSPTRPSSLQGSNIYENAFTFPDNANARMPENAQLVTSSNTKPNYSFRTPSNEYIDLSNGLPTKTKPPKPPTNENCVQAAEWHRKQRELDKSPAIEVTQQITTNAMVHAHPSEVCQSYSPSPLAIRQTNPIYSSTPNRYIHRPMSSPKSVNSSYNNLPQQVPIQQNSPSPKPEKQHILQDVEAFYWRELRKLKDKEEQDLFNYRQQQMQVYGYIEDPVLSRRSRSVSPSMQRGRRSLSLPRDVRQVQLPMKPPILGPEPIPEGRPVIAKRPITLPTEPDYVAIRQPLQRNPNFIRNTFERSTIGPIGMNVNYPAVENFRGYRQTTPIFKRGSLTGNINTPENPYQMGKKVSFSSNRNPDNSTSWPTKNGFTKSPPTRRVEREVSLDDDVFLPNTTVSNAANARAEELYIRRKNQGEQYRVTNQSVQSNGAQYGASSRQLQYVDRRDPVGLRQTVQPVYASTAPKTITVYNKECDIYGQIHDSGQKVAEDSPDYGYVRYQGQDETPYGVIRQSGLVYGQLQSPNSSNPVVLRQSHNQLNSPQQNFVRGTRLTASVNDMYRRYPAENVRYVDPRYNAEVRYSNERVLEGPQRPLPPVPERKDSRAISVRKIIRGYVPLSDNESGSEAGEVQRILRSGSKQKNFNVIGK